jgi:hypothetical protein
MLRHVTHAVPYHNRLANEKGNRQQNRNISRLLTMCVY